MLPIRLRGACTHTLRHLDLDLHPGELIALTGPSGSGKSSLGLDTLYAEGQRRFVESFSPYARQFLERLERPPVDSLDPVAATVAIDRSAPVKSSRSTLATMTELEPYFAALFARDAVPRCSDCDVDAVPMQPKRATTEVLAAFDGEPRALVSYPVRVDDAEGFLELRETLAKDGYRRMLVDGHVREIDDLKPSEASGRTTSLEVVIDRLAIRSNNAKRIEEAIETAWRRGDGRASLIREDAGNASRMSLARGLSCPSCGVAFEEPRAGLFSYNSPLGACASCHGFGRVIRVDWDKVIPDPKKSLEDGAIRPWAGKSAEWERAELEKFAKKRKISMKLAWGDLTDTQRALVLDGEGHWDDGKFPGVRAWFKWLESRTYKMHVRVLLSRYREYAVCESCNGARLSESSLRYRVAGLHLGEWHKLSVTNARARLAAFSARDPQGKRAQIELDSRLRYLEEVGLGYLSLDRQSRTLSGGEAQRASLTTALGATLTGTMFVLDEPTVGLHATDIPPLARVMSELSHAGNTVLVIEHDSHVVKACDRVIELGPGAGKLGGQILFDGTPEALEKRLDTPTGSAWNSAKSGAARPRRETSRAIVIRGARANNLRGIDVRIPLGVVCAITGPSGSGKSTLASGILSRGVARLLGNATGDRPLDHDSIDGIEQLSRVAHVDQSPLGRTARGNPATYTKAWDRLRARFASEPEAIAKGLTPAHFSFNVAIGRCDACSGEGYETVEMQFLADVALLCASCQGRRFKPEVLAIRHLGLRVDEVLAMTIDDALRVFDREAAERDYVLSRALAPAARVGLSYLPLGQPLSTLSGGEAQRLKLARALSEDARGCLFVIDEPSAGLHAKDAAEVIATLHALASDGGSVVVVDHDLELIRAADWVIDLGPGGGPDGGTIVCEGTPETIAKSPSRTGIALRGEHDVIKRRPRGDATAGDAIVVSHAREHNLKDVSVRIPHGSLSVVTGPSGSGKSSLAFDVIFAEGQRRFLETLTPYARQFLPTLPRPDVDAVIGVPPSIALEQRSTRGGANSTVATVTEVAHYLRLLYAKVGDLHCPSCDARIEAISADDLFERITSKRRIATLFSPAVRARKGTYEPLFASAARAGITHARVDGALVSIEPPPKLSKTKDHTIDLVSFEGDLRALPRETFNRALSWGNGAVRVESKEGARKTSEGESEILSTERTCGSCGTGVPEIDPRWFSFNTKQGQCESCEGCGIDGGAEAAANGATRVCRACDGTRLSAVPRRVRLFDETYPEFLARDVASALAEVRAWTFGKKGPTRRGAAEIARAPHGELVRRLEFMQRVGLGYLALDRRAGTLSGGEMQRLRLSAQLGSGLTGALYVLDEPTIGLHPRDTALLVENLRALTRMGSTVLVVEHDAETIRAADHVIDLGPSGGRGGGHIVSQGTAAFVLSDPKSPTAAALNETAPAARPNRTMSDAWIEVTNARANNLKDVRFRIPTARMCVVAGVSGSGKSTLVQRVFFPALRRAIGLVADEPGEFGRITGFKSIKRALAVDQSPIGRTPRSVPATFLGIWDEIRKLFAKLPEARTRGYTPARFSFNTASGGRCPSCEGQGMKVAEMSFLPDVISPCETCLGARFESSTEEIRFSNLSIGDVLKLSAEDAASVFQNHPKIAAPLRTLHELGVGYLQLGQGSNTLSGGEAQRLKLAAELTAGAMHEPTVYVLDEPTTGLHLADVRRLIATLERLVARGDTLVIVEHHPDLIASADWVVELGPEAGAAGGQIVFEGAPQKLPKAKTATGRFFASCRMLASP